jgi:hypothetical protein
LRAQRIIGASGVAERDPDGADYTGMVLKNTF